MQLKLSFLNFFPLHSPLEPLVGQIQIAQAATYAKRFAKMSTLRNAWFENREKKVFWEKSHFMKYPVYFFNDQYFRKSMNQKLLKMFQVTVTIFFYFDEIRKMKEPFYMHFYRNSILKIKKKNIQGIA